MNELTPEQIEVLFEFVEFAKRPMKSFYPPLVKSIVYDYAHEEGESIELLNKHFYEILKAENLNDEDRKILAQLVSQREGIYEAIDPEDLFGVDQSYLNPIRAERLKNYPTNGKEYL